MQLRQRLKCPNMWPPPPPPPPVPQNRESWYMAYIMDTNEEERAKVRGVHAVVVEATALCIGRASASP